jgi:hypothetical protein
MSEFKIIEFSNFKDYLNQKVEVDITSYNGGMCYPDDNTLIGMNEFVYYFLSGEGAYWHFQVTDDIIETLVYIEKN